MSIIHFDQIFLRIAQKPASTVCVAAAEDANVLFAAGQAHAKGIANFIMIGDVDKIRSLADASRINIEPFTLVNVPDAERACQVAVKTVAEGRAQALMKGHVDTSIIMSAVLSKNAGMRTGKKLSHLAAFGVARYHKLLFMTDAAINIAPDTETMQEIIENATDALRNFGLAQPKVALLAAKEKVDPKMPVTLEIEKLVKAHAAGWVADCTLDGPFALDNAVNRESAEIKDITSPVAGDADLLVCPNIESANILYKSLVFLGEAQNGGVVIGAARPIILTSRADSALSKLISIALGVLF